MIAHPRGVFESRTYVLETSCGLRFGYKLAAYEPRDVCVFLWVSERSVALALGLNRQVRQSKLCSSARARSYPNSSYALLEVWVLCVTRKPRRQNWRQPVYVSLAGLVARAAEGQTPVTGDGASGAGLCWDGGKELKSVFLSLLPSLFFSLPFFSLPPFRRVLVYIPLKIWRLLAFYSCENLKEPGI